MRPQNKHGVFAPGVTPILIRALKLPSSSSRFATRSKTFRHDMICSSITPNTSDSWLYGNGKDR
ncbi:hypothetical protein BamMEX5DRAFT_2152 [Burkholderia ambifaria MEX-5]|uniref:Uncharacterized protein n=1 Tax=Burkholderia ambifaria MEX-5 TaxID=396597 RepID=B1T2Y6_9BURK|nr:hypothetical protein BamMEX5DRAFT_2152 [Burkholderia ambifaria MEX-5]